MDVAMAREIASCCCRLYISADEVNVLTQIEDGPRSKTV